MISLRFICAQRWQIKQKLAVISSIIAKFAL